MAYIAPPSVCQGLPSPHITPEAVFIGVPKDAIFLKAPGLLHVRRKEFVETRYGVWIAFHDDNQCVL